MSDFILYMMIFFAILGGLDKIFGNRFGLGKKFEEGIMTMGPMAVAILGIGALAPAIARLLLPMIAPIFNLFGGDPSAVMGILLAPDLGGYSAAMEIAGNRSMGLFSGLLVAAMLGQTLSFSIPVGMAMIKEKDKQFFAKGILVGIVTIPIGSFIGGIIAGFSVYKILINMIPLLVLSAVLAAGLVRIPEKVIKGFGHISSGIMVLGTLGIIISIFETFVGITLLPGMTPMEEGIKIVGKISIILSGAFPMMYVFTKLLKKPLSWLGKRIGIGDVAVAGILASIANNIMMFEMFKDMDDRGKIINSAFTVSAAFTFGGQFGFIAGVEKEMIVPVVIGKVIGGLSALLLAHLIFSRTQQSNSMELGTAE
jgi:ethanolamine transporter